VVEFVRCHWQGRVPLARVFWWNMLIVGTLVNLITGGTALAAHVAGAPFWLAALVFFLPLPLNVLLTVSVWRSSGQEAPGWGAFARATALVWLAVMLVV
jgi:hypothetical protein